MDAALLVRRVRREAKLSVRALADAAGVAASTVHRIEHGDLQPTIDTLRRIVEAAGMRLDLEPRPDHTASITGLARSIGKDVASGDRSWPVRKAAELVKRFDAADRDTRHRMIAAEPSATGDVHWDAFLAALAEWLAVRTGLPAPEWVHRESRYVHGGWWVTPMRSMRAWEYAGSPASFQNHGVYLHRDSLANV